MLFVCNTNHVTHSNTIASLLSHLPYNILSHWPVPLFLFISFLLLFLPSPFYSSALPHALTLLSYPNFFFFFPPLSFLHHYFSFITCSSSLSLYSSLLFFTFLFILLSTHLQNFLFTFFFIFTFYFFLTQVPATDVSIILSTEPIFASLFAASKNRW